MNVVFFGTPELAVPFLEAAIQEASLNVVAVVTQEDKPVGRKKVLTPSPVKVRALESNIPVFYAPAKQDDESKEDLHERYAQMFAEFGEIDLFIIIAYGRIIPARILEIPARGSINVHPSKLPHWRGPSPIQSTILAGDTESAISIMRIDEKMDHGPILAQKNFKVPTRAFPEDIERLVMAEGPELLIKSVLDYLNGTLEPQEQDHDSATFCKLINREDGEVKWEKQSAEEIEHMWRAYTPWPGIWTLWDGKRLKLQSISLTAEDTLTPGEVHAEKNQLFIGTTTTDLAINQLQLEGKPSMETQAFLQGNADINGAHLNA